MSVQESIIALIIGYLFGNIPNGYLYAKAHGIDIFKEGSGNPGSTNVLRTLGKRAGITVLLMDIAKCVVPIFFMMLFFKPGNEDQKTLLMMVTGLGAILGHNFPFLSKVKGGKGVACTGALLLVLAPLFAVLYRYCYPYRICQLRFYACGDGVFLFRSSFWKERHALSFQFRNLSSHVYTQFYSRGDLDFPASGKYKEAFKRNGKPLWKEEIAVSKTILFLYFPFKKG